MNTYNHSVIRTVSPNRETFIPTVMYSDVKQWFLRFYYGEYGEMIMNRILNFYKYFQKQAGESADIIYIARPGFTDNYSWAYFSKNVPEMVDLYHMMLDFGCTRMELPLININEIEEALKDKTFSRYHIRDFF